jgi:phosphoribosylaminoimidazole-succinocarboxamide synthase
VGDPLAARLRDLTVAVLARGNELARERGILIADTKVEFGLDLPASADWAEAGPDGLVLADEVLTPDSSRFWPADLWSPGRPQASYDKQFVRDWLTSPASGWDRSSGEPPPPLPDEVVERTRERYVEAYTRLTGRPFP